MTSANLVELVYLSTAARTFGVTELRELLGKARRKNRTLDLTGLLLHADGSFLQVLEGPAPSVDEIFAHIERDPRHRNVVVVSRRTIEVRTFPSWRMGFVEPVSAMRSELLGFSHVLTAGDGALPASLSEAVRSLIAELTGGRGCDTDSPPANESAVRLR